MEERALDEDGDHLTEVDLPPKRVRKPVVRFSPDRNAQTRRMRKEETVVIQENTPESQPLPGDSSDDDGKSTGLFTIDYIIEKLSRPFNSPVPGITPLVILSPNGNGDKQFQGINLSQYLFQFSKRHVE